MSLDPPDTASHLRVVYSDAFRYLSPINVGVRIYYENFGLSCLLKARLQLQQHSNTIHWFRVYAIPNRQERPWCQPVILFRRDDADTAVFHEALGHHIFLS